MLPTTSVARGHMGLTCVCLPRRMPLSQRRGTCLEPSTCPAADVLCTDNFLVVHIFVFWTCPKLKECDHPDVASTTALGDRAVSQADTYPCLWFRALLPKSLTHLVPRVPIDSFFFGDPPSLRAGCTPGTEMHFYSDASGGPHSLTKSGRYWSQRLPRNGRRHSNCVENMHPLPHKMK